MRTLIVEDSLVNQEFLLMIMESFGECVVVESGEEGMQKVAGSLKTVKPFDLIFLDVMLPGISGIEALQHMRELERLESASPAKVIIISSLEAEDLQAQGLVMDDSIAIMPKPIRPDIVESTLTNLGFTL